jgi:hypothetical protein
MVSKRTYAPYHSGSSGAWLKAKNPASDAVRKVHLITLAVLEQSLYLNVGSPVRMRLGGVEDGGR